MKYTLNYYNGNNYYNRKCIAYDSILDYNFHFQQLKTVTDVNFIDGDGLLTTQVINWNSIDKQPDYLVVTLKGKIISRWFVIKNEILSGTQFRQTLKRDTVADYYKEIINAPTFIEKATLDPSDPAIYNKEDMSFNQIKKEEYLLKDKTNCAWLVGYVARDYNTKQDFTVSTYFDEEYSSLESSPYAKYLNKNYLLDTGSTHLVGKFIHNDWPFVLGFYNTKNEPARVDTRYENVNLQVNNTPIITEDPIYFALDCSTRIREQELIYPTLNSLAFDDKFINSEDESFIVAKKDKIIKIGDTYYRVEVEQEPYVTEYIQQGRGTNAQLYFNRAIGLEPTESSYVYIEYKGRKVRTDLIKLENNGENGKASLDFSQVRKKVVDQPFDMFCMPYADYKIKVNSTTSFDTTKNNNLSLAMGLASLNGVIYDLQLLPYCPLTVLPTDNTIDLTKLDSQEYTMIKIVNNNVGVVIWCDRSSFTFNIDKTIEVDNPKITNETEMYRLCSPNYNGVFEFNPAKNMVPNNKVAISYFNVDCTYKPYQPYIHIAFDFKGLYGSDFNDARGLICSGDFSLPSATDTWKSYEIQNKNYKATFDRQIESQELKNKVDKTTEIINGITGSVAGGLAGGILKGPTAGVGMAVGGMVDTAIGVGVKDLLRRDSLDLTRDNFGFQMDNIQALPNTINKVGSFNANNKIFPFLERYDCTDIEKEALLNKLKYNGMTVGRIGKIKDFLREEETYIKGQIIRLDGLNDYNEVTDASNEIYQGVFIKDYSKKGND